MQRFVRSVCRHRTGPWSTDLLLSSRSTLHASRRWRAVFQPHAALQTSPLPLKEVWLASLDEDARNAADRSWTVDFVSIRDAALTLGCRTAAEEAHFVRATSSALANQVDPVESLSLQLNDGETLVAAAQLLHRALTTGSLKRLAITLQPPSISSATASSASASTAVSADAEGVCAFFDTLARLPRTPALASFALNVTEASWTDAATASLAAFLSSLQLHTLTLNYVPLRNGYYAALSALATAVTHSAATLESLDLKGMGPLLHHTALLQSRGDNKCLADFCRLQHLDVSHTQLGDVAMAKLFTSLRSAIGGWTQLRTLGLAQCDVTAYAVGHMLRGVPELGPEGQDGVETSTVRVESLNLSSNSLTDDLAFELASCLVACRQLRSLDLRHNRFTRRSIGTVLGGLMHATQLRTLRLRANRVQDEGFQHIAPLLRYWPALEELDLTRCHVTSASLCALASALPQMSRLRVLRLSGNDFHQVKRPLPPRSLDSSSGANSGLVEGEGDVKLFAYDPAYMRGDGGRDASKVPTCYELDRRDRETGRVRYRGPTLDDVADGEESMAAARLDADSSDVFATFGEALNSCRHLEILDLSDTSLSDEGFVRLSSVGLALSSLHTLNLSANPLFRTVAALDQLVALLWCTPLLETLDVSFTALGDLGLSMLCDGAVADTEAVSEDAAVGVLTMLTRLRCLYLAHCGATEGLGMEALAGCLPQLHALKVLVLNGNTVQHSAVTPLKTLLESAHSCPQLRYISLHGCAGTAEARNTLETSPVRRRLLSAGVDVLV